MKHLASALAFAFLVLVLSAQEISPDMQAVIERAVKVQRAWGVKMNTPGVVLTAKETNRGSQDGHTLVSYELHAEGLPLDGDYELDTSPVTLRELEMTSTGDVSLDKKGRVIDGPDDPRVLIIPDALPGEPFRFALVSKDQQYRAFVAVQPNPIRGSDHNCQIATTRLAPKFEIAYIEGTGFPAKTELPVATKSYDEAKDLKVTTDQNGHFDVTLLPAVLGKNEGDTNVQVNAPQCKPKLKFHWGSKER